MVNGVRITKTQLAKALADRTGMRRSDALGVVNALFGPRTGIIARALSRGESVRITGFGTFEPRQRKARAGRNPRTGGAIMIPAAVVPAFRAGKGLKEAVKRISI